MWVGFNNFLKLHERLILVIGLVAGAVWGLSVYFNHTAASDKLKADAATQVLQQQTAINKQQAQQTQQLIAQNQQILQTLAAQNQQLQQGILARNQQVVKQQSADAGLTPAQLASRLQSLSGGNVTPNAGGYQVDQQSAVLATQKLDEVPVLQQNIADLTTMSANKDREIQSDDGVIASQNTQLVGLGVQLVDQTKACSAEVASVKASARKGKLKWFGIGYVSGFISGLIVRVGAI